MSNRVMTFTPQDLVQVVIRYRRRWIVPTVAVTVLALAYALIHRPAWDAWQSLTVRDEAVGTISQSGRFRDSDQMKTAMETVVELARSRTVVEAALKRVGPAGSTSAGNTSAGDHSAWPSSKDIQATQDEIRVSAPNGVEFGRTDVFHLRMRHANRSRALELVTAVCDELDQRLRQLRDERAQSLIDELSGAVQLAQEDLNEATVRLSATERQVGSDLGELRVLNESAAGESNLRQMMVQVKNELRQARDRQRTNVELLALLASAQDDPDQLVATPNELLRSQPALQRLKDGLIDAQLRSATLLGGMSNEHPQVRSARQAEQEIRRHLHNEVTMAIGGVQAEMKLGDARIQTIQEQLDDVTRRMTHLSGLRAGYGNLVADVRQRTETLKTLQQKLSAARANRFAAHSASVLTKLDPATTGDSPAGPGRATIVVIGMLGGLTIGLGVLFLTVPLPSGQTADRSVREPETPAGSADRRDLTLDQIEDCLEECTVI